jgi:DNA invertase Pin-like site-specific DNA recombinase
MKSYFAYIRVSTPKQGKGVSLEEQQAAIKAHAERRGIEVVEWFEERETAAKAGRAVFSRMLARLESGEAEGVIIHKIDRSARNLWDWANLSKLFDRGIDVQFAHDSVDLSSRGGRLSADIMAIVAADYIRNLREEVKKGFYGRLKQGI